MVQDGLQFIPKPSMLIGRVACSQDVSLSPKLHDTADFPQDLMEEIVIVLEEN